MKIFKIIYYIFIGLIALVAVLLIVSTFEIPGNFKAMTVLSGSMEPAIKMGSVVVVKPAGDYKINDVITFGEMTKTKTPTTHRIVDMRVTEGVPSYITKGDANNAPDTREVLKKEIIGKVLFSVPYAGYAVDAARKPIGFALLIIIPALLIIFDEVRKIYAEIKKKKQITNHEK
ncbi:signal peptidase I [Candidatus Parcubacteria bacterium]|nr:signal peptidase I [Candidatus Parcubacteria bacterium]